MAAMPMSVHATVLGRPSAITCVPRRQVLRRSEAAHGHHASDSAGITPPSAGEQFVTVSSVLQKVLLFAISGGPPVSQLVSSSRNPVRPQAA